LERNLDSRLDPFEQEIATGRISEQENQSRLASLYAQQKLEASKLELSEQQLKRAQDLFNKGVISATDFGQQKTFALQARQAYDQITLSISQQREAISMSRRQLSDGQKSKEKSEATGKSAVTLAMDELRKSIADWESEHLLYAPADGLFALQGSWRENQSVKAGDVIATFMPDAQSRVWGALTVAATNSGKIMRGQKVLLRLDNYPYQEFGSVSGKVVSMSPLPDAEGHYFVSVALPKGLLTSYGKKIRFSRELSGNAQIITDDMRLLDRFFYKLVKRVGR
jgi:multidrug resistance efflux pump